MKLSVDSDDCYLIRKALREYVTPETEKLLKKLEDQYDLFRVGW